MAVVCKIFHGQADTSSGITEGQAFGWLETEITTYFNDNTILKNDIISLNQSINPDYDGGPNQELTVVVIYDA